MTGYGNIAKTKQDGSWVKYVFSLMPEKNNSQSCAQPLEWPFELGFTEQIPKILEDNSEHFRGFGGTLLESERAKNAPKYISDRNVSRLFFRKEHQFIP